jgi:hypothetical protein
MATRSAEQRQTGWAESRRLRQALARGNRFSQVQKFNRQEASGSDSVRAEGRGLHRLQGDQPHGQSRHTSLPEGRLNTSTEGEACPNAL